LQTQRRLASIAWDSKTDLQLQMPACHAAKAHNLMDKQENIAAHAARQPDNDTNQAKKRFLSRGFLRAKSVEWRHGC